MVRSAPPKPTGIWDHVVRKHGGDPDAKSPEAAFVWWQEEALARARATEKTCVQVTTAWRGLANGYYLSDEVFAWLVEQIGFALLDPHAYAKKTGVKRAVGRTRGDGAENWRKSELVLDQCVKGLPMTRGPNETLFWKPADIGKASTAYEAAAALWVTSHANGKRTFGSTPGAMRRACEKCHVDKIYSG